MKKRQNTSLALALITTLLGCFAWVSVAVANPSVTMLDDGIYSAEFHSDSSMFHVNEANAGKGILSVEDGEMHIHICLPSKNIINLFVGSAKDAQLKDADLLEPSVESVTYSDGWKEEVYAYDIPVSTLDEGFAVALVGKKGKWYDHMVYVSNPVPIE